MVGMLLLFLILCTVFYVVLQIGGDLVHKHLVLHRMRDLPAGFHLYDEITGNQHLGTLCHMWMKPGPVIQSPISSWSACYQSLWIFCLVAITSNLKNNIPIVAYQQYFFETQLNA